MLPYRAVPRGHLVSGAASGPARRSGSVSAFRPECCNQGSSRVRGRVWPGLIAEFGDRSYVSINVPIRSLLGAQHEEGPMRYGRMVRCLVPAVSAILPLTAAMAMFAQPALAANLCVGSRPGCFASLQAAVKRRPRRRHDRDRTGDVCGRRHDRCQREIEGSGGPLDGDPRRRLGADDRRLRRVDRADRLDLWGDDHGWCGAVESGIGAVYRRGLA